MREVVRASPLGVFSVLAGFVALVVHAVTCVCFGYYGYAVSAAFLWAAPTATFSGEVRPEIVAAGWVQWIGTAGCLALAVMSLRRGEPSRWPAIVGLLLTCYLAWPLILLAVMALR